MENKSQRISVLDCNTLFDNFDKFCTIDFNNKLKKTKTPCIVRDLSKTFEKIARDKQIQRSSQEKKQQQRPKLKKTRTKDSRSRDNANSKKFGNLRSRLKISLDDVFQLQCNSTNLGNRGKPESSKNEAPYKSYFNNKSKVELLNLIKKSKGVKGKLGSIVLANKTLGESKRLKKATNSVLNSTNPHSRSKKKNRSLEKSMLKGTLLRTLQGQMLKKQTVISSFDKLKTTALINQPKSIRKKLPERIGASGSTRLPTTSRIESNKRTPISFLETENKSKSMSQMRSCLLEKNGHLSNSNFAKQLNRSMGLKNSIKLNFQMSKEKYYLPSGVVSTNYRKHHSFAHSEEISKGVQKGSLFLSILKSNNPQQVTLARSKSKKKEHSKKSSRKRSRKRSDSNKRT